ncbi:MAG TPA: S41 family peptidase [Ramlibacter sp.]|nr:S41 family peptidase [Ramlibacter sp.]
MRHLLPTFRAFAAAWLLVATGAALADPPSPPSDEETIATLQAAFMQSVMAGEQADLHRELLANVLQRVKRSHATEVDLPAFAAAARKTIDATPPGSGNPPEVFKKSINEALRTLDPTSRYIEPRIHATAAEESTGSFGGLGLEVQASEGAVRVVAPIPGSPAARAGLATGDLIVRVDDHSLKGVSLADAIAKMRGQPGTPVTITVRREGNANEFTVSLTRDTIRRQMLRWNLEGDVLVLRLSEFSGPVGTSLTQAIAEATAIKQPSAVVLDLRGNPGGLLREAVRVADTFLAEGEIVSLRGNTPARRRAWQADAEEMLAGLPMVVLIDGRSASASELVADALQANGRATVMGQRSYGKGSVQVTFPLGEHKGALKLTTSLYYGPSGQTVNKVGVVPDIELVALSKPVPADAASARAAKAAIDPARCPPLRAADPALSCAVSYLSAGNVDAFIARLAD